MKRISFFPVLLMCFVSSCTVFSRFSSRKSDFTLWQLPSQTNTIGNSYVFKMKNGQVAVMDGGFATEAPYLKGFLAALGNRVDVWFISHPHSDHIGALNAIMKNPGDLKIGKIYYSAFSLHLRSLEPEYKKEADQFDSLLAVTKIPAVNLTKPGFILKIGKTVFKVLGVTNEEISVNPYNNSCMVIKVWDKKKSVLFLADTGVESGNKLLNGPYRKDLDCDYLQMAHHGQRGVSKDFYRTIKFKACLWPSPSWVYNNDIGKGYNTYTFQTVEIRNLVDSLGIKKNYPSCMGLQKIE